VLPVPVAASVARVDIADPLNPAGYVEAGRLVLDRAFRPGGGRNLRYGWGIEFRSGDIVQAALDGATQGDARGTARVLGFAVPALAADAWGAWYDLVLARGRARDVVAIVDPDAAGLLPRQAVHGRLEDLGGIVHRRHPIHDIRCRIVEAL